MVLLDYNFFPKNIHIRDKISCFNNCSSNITQLSMFSLPGYLTTRYVVEMVSTQKINDTAATNEKSEVDAFYLCFLGIL